MENILIRYAEIALKGGNRHFFENQLIRNIKLVLQDSSLQIIKLQKQILISSQSINVNKLKTVFGIAWFAPVIITSNDLASISVAVLKLASPGKTFAIRSHHDLAVSLGDIIRIKKKIAVDLTRPEQIIYVSQTKDQAFVFNRKIQGLGGLPVGTAGKVLCLLSGGFDSIAAAYLLAKRGARVDFLHFHVFSDYTQVLNSKIKIISDQLKIFTFSRRLFLASYIPFQFKVLDLQSNLIKHELVVYRRLMVRVGEELAKQYSYQALVLGDSLGQVASQTLENICAVDQVVNLPIFRPLIGTDKKDIIALIRTIGLESIVNQPYKDCCSLISIHPATTANFKKIQELEKRIKIHLIIKQIVKNVQNISL